MTLGQPTGTPLPPIASRPVKEMTAFLRGADDPFDDLAHWVSFDTEDDRAAISLAMGMTEEAGPAPVPVLSILWAAYQFGAAGPLPLNALRIGARVWESGGSGDTPPWGSELTPEGMGGAAPRCRPWPCPRQRRPGRLPGPGRGRARCQR